MKNYLLALKNLKTFIYIKVYISTFSGIPLNFHVFCRAMFTGELAESRQTEVVIRDIDERAMELLIDFAYTSQVTAAAAAFPTTGRV